MAAIGIYDGYTVALKVLRVAYVDETALKKIQSVSGYAPFEEIVILTVYLIIGILP